MRYQRKDETRADWSRSFFIELTGDILQGSADIYFKPIIDMKVSTDEISNVFTIRIKSPFLSLRERHIFKDRKSALYT